MSDESTDPVHEVPLDHEVPMDHEVPPDREVPLEHEVAEPRASRVREWEVFVRAADDEPLTHGGSVSAPDRDVAVEQAAQLFDHAATTLWLCPADEVTRRTTADRSLADRAQTVHGADNR